VLLLSWEVSERSDLDAENEVEQLGKVFREEYGYATEPWKIPLQSSHHKLTSKVLDFVGYGGPDSLLIVYYSGHGSLTKSRQSQWLRWELSIISISLTQNSKALWDRNQETLASDGREKLY
jgi:hypothetical protein